MEQFNGNQVNTGTSTPVVGIVRNKHKEELFFIGSLFFVFIITLVVWMMFYSPLAINRGAVVAEETATTQTPAPANDTDALKAELDATVISTDEDMNKIDAEFDQQ